MTNKVYYTDKQIDGLIQNIIRQIVKDQWVPDYIVGIGRGGLIPAVKISHYLDINLETITVSLRGEEERCESNCWMAEDAYDGKKILIVDDINDSGATLEWIKKDWSMSAYREDPKWDSIWNESVRFATLIDNDASDTQINYIGESINKAENDVWVTFPWEDWWNGQLTMTLLELILLIVFCAVATFLLYGMYLIEADNDKFRKEHGYKPKYHNYKEEENDKNQDQ